MKAKIALAASVTVALVALTIGSATYQPGVQATSTGVALAQVPVEQVAKGSNRDMLQVNNQTPFIIIVYIGGIRIGWMRPYHTGLIRGLLTGYHRLYAHSQYGTTSWGPRDAWIPGTWNLLY
jgi:hypothetical protein